MMMIVTMILTGTRVGMYGGELEVWKSERASVCKVVVKNSIL